MSEADKLYDAADQLRAAGKNDEAVAQYQEVLKLEPGYALAHSALAVVLTDLGRHDEAVRHALRVCELEPNDTFSYTALSVTCMRAGKIPEAEDAMARARMLQQHR
ncbi:MAG: tetratricopeptide repeat protein [Planctomycetaceae bacterium]|nr:tetratricopeptide repeat protein [Planctomycetaceae bacterium]